MINAILPYVEAMVSLTAETPTHPGYRRMPDMPKFIVRVYVSPYIGYMKAIIYPSQVKSVLKPCWGYPERKTLTDNLSILETEVLLTIGRALC